MPYKMIIRSIHLLLAFCSCFALSAQQEWAYHQPEHLDHSHIIVDANWGTERVVAAVSHYNLGSGSSGATSSTPEGSSILIRQKDDGTLLWQQQYFYGFLLRISDIKVVPGTNGQNIAAVGHVRLSTSGTFSDRGIMMIVDAGTGNLIDFHLLNGSNPQLPLDSRLLGLDFYSFQNQMHIACAGWTGDVTSAAGGHKGLYIRSLIGPSGFSFQGALEFDSPDGGNDYDFLGKVVNDGSGILVIGSSNQFDINSQNEQGALVAKIQYDGTYAWGKNYWETAGTPQDDGVVAADILASPNQPLLLAMNHLKDQKMSLSTLDPNTGTVISAYSIDVPLAQSQMGIIKAFDLEAVDDAGFVLGGYLHEHPWTDASGAQLGNIPFRFTGTINDTGLGLGDLKAFRSPSKAAGETVNNWAYAPFPQDRWQPYVYHPEMLTLEVGNDPNIDLLLTGYRERSVSMNRFDLDIIPTNMTGSFGPCETVNINELTSFIGLSEFSIPDPVVAGLSLFQDSIASTLISLDTLNCGVLSTPLCSLPNVINSTVNCLEVDVDASGGITPPMQVHYSWDFGDGSAAVSGVGLNHPPIHSYATPGTYSIDLTRYCIWDMGTSSTISTAVTVDVCAPSPCDIGPFDLDLWLYCGQGCWGGIPGTRAAVTIDMNLFSLDESQFDAELCFSDGTTIPLDLDGFPLSFIKCFSGFTLFKQACLKVYEEGETVPCYEVCDSESCISVGPIPFDWASDLIPELAFNSSSCSIEFDGLPESITSTTQVMVFNSAYPGGNDAASFLSAFLQGEDFSELASYQSENSSFGSYQGSCYNLFEAQLTHPVVYIEGDNGTQDWQTAALEAGPNAILISGLPQVQLVSALIPGDTYLPGDTYIPGDTYTSGDTFLGFNAIAEGSGPAFSDLIPLGPVLAGTGFNSWNLSGTAGPGGSTFFTAGSENCLPDNIGDGEETTFYDNGILGAASFAVTGNTSIPIVEGNQACPNNRNYLAQATLEVLNTAPLFEENGALPMGEWPPLGLVGQALLTDAELSSNATEGSTQELVIDYYDGYGDSSGPWSITDAGGNVVATDSMPAGLFSSTGSVNLAPGHYTFSWELDCFGGIDNSGIQLSLNGATVVNFASGTVLPGIITEDIFIPGTVIAPPMAYVDTTCDAAFSHDLMTTGALPPSTPGTYIASEDNIQLGFEMFFDGFGTTYGSAAVTSALPSVGSGQVLTTSNILAVYDMSAFPNVNEVSFVFFDGAGIENLQVNGHALLTGELETMPTAVAPGVTMSVTTSSYPGYQTGTVVLTGNVQKLEVGGQQFFVDHICVKHDGTVIQAPPVGSCAAACDAFTGFELLTAGDRYGDLAEGANISVAVGALATTSDGIPIYLEPLHDFSASYYNYMAVDAHYGGWGSGMVIQTNNITAQFDIGSVVPVTDTVCIAFRDEGGFENIWINGAPPLTGPNGYGGLTIFNGINVGGVQVLVTGAMAGGFAFEGTVTLIGDVDKFSIGGQELWLDDLCISSPVPSPSLTEVVAADGEEALLELLSVSFDSDTATCQMAMALQLESGFPAVDEVQLQISNNQTGEVVSSVLIAVDIITGQEDDGSDEGDSGGPLINDVGVGIAYGIIAANVPLPEVGEGVSLAVSLVFSDTETTVVVEIPGLTFPGCPGGGFDLPCVIDATFNALETPCGVFSILSAPQPSAVETWTLDGLPYLPIGDPNAFSLNLPEGGHLLCRTVTNLLLPNCSDTFCHPLLVDCSADSCDYSFTHEAMSFGAVNTALTYTEDHIDLTFAGYDDGLGSGPSLGNAFVDNAIPGIGTDQVLLLSNVNADYNLTSLINVSRVTFDYFDGAGIENLMVNGSFLIDEFGVLEGSTFTHGGIDVFITRITSGAYAHGEVILTGNVQSFAVGGQQFYVDNVCVSADGVDCTSDSDEDGICDEDETAGCTDSAADNYDPSATDDDGSCEFELGSACPTDINGNGTTDTQDLLLLLGNFSLVCGE
jgi:PKD repeat protein